MIFLSVVLNSKCLPVEKVNEYSNTEYLENEVIP